MEAVFPMEVNIPFSLSGPRVYSPYLHPSGLQPGITRPSRALQRPLSGPALPVCLATWVPPKQVAPVVVQPCLLCSGRRRSPSPYMRPFPLPATNHLHCGASGPRRAICSSLTGLLPCSCVLLLGNPLWAGRGDLRPSVQFNRHLWSPSRVPDFVLDRGI